MHGPPLTAALAPGALARSAHERREVWDAKGNRVTFPQIDVRLDYVSGPPLACPSGRLVAGDLQCGLSDDARLALPVPAGTFPTEAVVAEFPDGSRIPAFAIVRISDLVPAQWTMALRDGDDVADFEEGEFPALGVDFGAIGIADADAVHQFDGSVEANMIKQIDERLRSSPVAGGAITETSVVDVVAFTSGRGDGAYGVGWGMSDPVHPACLLVDFNIVENHLIAGAPHQPWWRRLARRFRR